MYYIIIGNQKIAYFVNKNNKYNLSLLSFQSGELVEAGVPFGTSTTLHLKGGYIELNKRQWIYAE